MFEPLRPGGVERQVVHHRVGVVERVEALAEAEVRSGIGDVEAPVASVIGERRQLIDARSDQLQVQLGGVDGIAVEVEVVQHQLLVPGQRELDRIGRLADEAFNRRLSARGGVDGAGSDVGLVGLRRLGLVWVVAEPPAEVTEWQREVWRPALEGFGLRRAAWRRGAGLPG